MLKTIKTMALAMTVMFAAAFASSANAGSLKVKINNVKNSKGTVHIFLFKSSGAFNSNNYNKATRYVKVRAKAGTVVGIIKGLKAGKYAISIFHDKNNNNKFDMRGQMPLEGYAYSNNVGANDYPTFNQAAFNFSGNGSVSMNTIYY